MNAQYLPEFQEFLVTRKFALEKNAPFFAYWVCKFLKFSNTNENLPLNIKSDKFLKYLAVNKTMADWQIEQAKTALRLYIDHFLKGNTAKLSPNICQKEQKDLGDLSYMLGKMREALRLKHYSYGTERSYIDWTKRFYAYIVDTKKKEVEKLESEDVRNYLSFLAIKQNVSSSTQNQAFNALLFLFRNVLDIELTGLGKTVKAKRGFRLPVVLSVEEIRQLFKRIRGKELLILQLLYGSGLRLMELVRLRVQDIDFNNNLIFIRSSKGDKDRTSVLPKFIKSKIVSHLKHVNALHEKDLKAGNGEVYLPAALERKYPNAAKDWRWQYVFPALNLSVDPRSGKIRRHHIGEKTIQNSVRTAVRKANIVKHATVHTLRHSFATHLLMNGVNIREIQDLLGHKNVETTMVYIHVLRDMANAPKSPLDNLYKDAAK